MSGWFMAEYPKINSLWKRGQDGRVLEGQWATPELEYLADCEWLWTEKVDGTNVRVGWEPFFGNVSFAGRRADQLPSKLRLALEAALPREAFLRAFPEGQKVTLYGEGYGAGIQKGGGLYRPDQGFVLFDVVVDGWWLSYDKVENVADKLGVAVAPLVGMGTLLEMEALVRRGLESELADGVAAEGLVARTPVGLLDRRGGQVFAKAKTRDYLG